MASYKVSTVTAIAFAGFTTAVLTLRIFLPYKEKRNVRKQSSVHETLPGDLTTWRLLEVEDSQRAWEIVRPAFNDAGVYVWPYDGLFSRADPAQLVRSNGFAYVTPVRGESWSRNFQRFNCHNELTRGGTTSDGLHVVVRVAVIGDEGKRHIEILRKLSTGTISLFAENHVVPLWNEVRFDDIVFTVSPYIGHSMRFCYGFWAKNSVGDIVDMIIQALEAIAFVHDLGIVHRDLCKHNYVVQWHPESLSTMRVPLNRPRVFLTDFETAFEFPHDVPPEQRLLTGPPIDDYQRQIAPEMASGMPYDPFKTDIWQLAESFSDFRATVPDIDGVLERMSEADPSLRLSAEDARDQLATVVHRTPPIALIIPPLVLNDDYEGAGEAGEAKKKNEGEVS